MFRIRHVVWVVYRTSQRLNPNGIWFWLPRASRMRDERKCGKSVTLFDVINGCYGVGLLAWVLVSHVRNRNLPLSGGGRFAAAVRLRQASRLARLALSRRLRLGVLGAVRCSTHTIHVCTWTLRRRWIVAERRNLVWDDALRAAPVEVQAAAHGEEQSCRHEHCDLDRWS